VSAGTIGIGIGEITTAPVAPASKTVLEVDRWGRRQAKRVAESWRDASLDVPAEEIVCDAHTALYEPAPAAAARPADRERAKFWADMMSTPEFRALRRETALDEVMSALASRAIVDRWAAYAETTQPPDAGGEGEGDGEGESVAQQVARMRAARDAVAKASEQVTEARATMAGLGMGAGAPVDMDTLAAYMRRACQDSTLRQILAMAGRLCQMIEAAQATKTIAERGEIVGVELSGDIARLLPTEVAAVAGVVPELEALALYRLATRRCLSYRQRRAERAAKGPIVVVVDESGSMRDEQKIVVAKGLALALASLARKERRWCALVGFGADSEIHHVVLPPTGHEPSALMDWAAHMFDGGTTLDVLAHIPRLWPSFAESGMQRGATDVIVVTDADVSAPEEALEAYRAWAREEQARTLSIVVGPSQPGSIGEVSDRVWTIPRLTADSEVIAKVLEI
jgi:uncharacterized protein with von Willebrand factor type A (vWA) domain